MIRILIAGNEKNRLSGLLKGLEQHEETEILSANSMEDAFDKISTPGIDLVIADENVYGNTGLAFVEKMVKLNPMINCAVVSSLSPKKFHEESEGLGVLMQLSVDAGEDQAILLINRLKKILNITGNIVSGRKGDTT